MIELTNTLTGKKEPLEPIRDRKLNMFVCGPTVYDYIHIGNARTFVFFDVVVKYLRHRGYEVDYIQNITDIDNKIIERAGKEGVDSLEYAKKYSEIFKQDMQALGVTSPKYKNATDHIPEVIKQVQILLDKKNAYVIENDPDASVGAGGIYFDLSTFPDYGKLSGKTTSMADDAVSRIDDSNKKRNRGDFALWKFSQEGDPVWDFGTGKYLGILDSAIPASAKASAGRPGWHIEDTAITEHYFGPQYDLHGGGQDLIFPHHEAEITQQESASGKSPFVKYWMHVAFVVSKEQKMSKSLGNFETANELLQEYSKEALRFYLLSGYYRSPLDFSEKILQQSEAGVQRLGEFYSRIKKIGESGSNNINTAIENIVAHKQAMFEKVMDDDFNTPEAIAAIFQMVREINIFVVKEVLSKEDAGLVIKFLDYANDVLGIVPTNQQEIPSEVSVLVDKREFLRNQKNWGDADKIRAQIKALGWKVEDTVYGPLVTKK